MDYKPAKTLQQQIDHLHDYKQVVFNQINEVNAKEHLLLYNYINIISPFKHYFAEKVNNELIKKNGRHVYNREIDFNEYYERYKAERDKYPNIIQNVIMFETKFKSILAYNILTSTKILNDTDLKRFLEGVQLNISANSKFDSKRIDKLNSTIDKLKNDIEKYHDVYCYFDRMTLGEALTIFCGLEHDQQNDIFKICKDKNLSFNVDKTPDFITKIFTTVSIRNCVIHGNSLEVLIRFYNPKDKTLRDSTNRKRFTSLIDFLSKENRF